MSRYGNGATDDEWCSCFIDEDGVDLINDGKVVPALDLLFFGAGHAVVTQVVEAKFSVRTIGDVIGINLASEVWWLIVLNAADGEPEELIQVTHPLGISFREVVVYGDDMNAAAGERVEIDGEGGDQGLAFTGGHLCDAPLVKGYPSDKLDVEVDHFPVHGLITGDEIGATESASRVLDHGKGFRKDLLEGSLEFIVILNF